ncbi:hypothetical protein ACRQ5Q_41455 (plasmid) [Bradyrhizobium sp. PMVTL-01]
MPAEALHSGSEMYSAFLLLTLFLVAAVHSMDADLADGANVAIVLQQPG